MVDNIFRFVNIRPPQRKEPIEGTIDYINPYRTGNYDTEFHSSLVQAMERGSREEVRTAADKYIVENGLVSHLAQLRTKLAVFDQAVMVLGSDSKIDSLIEKIRSVFDGEPKDLIKRDDFRIDHQSLAESMIAAFYASSVPSKGISHLVRGLRLCKLIELIATEDPSVSEEGGVTRILQATITIPFVKQWLELQVRDIYSVPIPLYRLGNYTTGRHFYTINSSERGHHITAYGFSDEGIACYVHGQQIPGTVPLYRACNLQGGQRIYTTSLAERDRHIQQFGYIDEGITCYVYSQAMAGTIPLYQLGSYKDGNRVYTVAPAERDTIIADYGYQDEGIACYVLPVSISAGAVRPAGIGDLLVVRQTLRRYERGEIAHVENALKGESKERSHRTTQTSETLNLNETETTNDKERDLQSSERFELKSEADKNIKENMQVQAGVQVSATYGTVTVSANGQFAYERSMEEATRSANSFAREVVEKAQERVQERTLQRRSTRTLLETEEVAKHGIENTAPDADHIVGVYRWIDKIYEAQVINYGKRLMMEFYVPEPAAYYRKLDSEQRYSGLTVKKPEDPVYENQPLSPMNIIWPGVQKVAAKYGAVGIKPPPAETIIIGNSIEVPYSDKDNEKLGGVILIPNSSNYVVAPILGSTKVSLDTKIPDGYVAVSVKFSGATRPYVRKNPPHPFDSILLPENTHVSIGSGTWESLANSDNVEVDGFTKMLPIAVITSAAGLILTVKILCKRTPEAVEIWQSQTYDTIMAAYQEQLQSYMGEVARFDIERGTPISGQPAAENRKTEQLELKREVISILTSQHFDAFGSVEDALPKDESKSPKLAFDKAAAESEYVRYFEQIFEWHNMTYLFYPYFWGRKNHWPDVLAQESADPIFKQFLRAGYARVQVPVRPNYESMVMCYLTSSKLFQVSDDAPVVQPYLPIADEIRNQTGDDFNLGKGTIMVIKDDVNVVGTGSAFSSDDINREIRIQAKVYRIVKVVSTRQITLAKPFAGKDEETAAYSLGPKLVGPPWEVRLPTTLVMIDKPEIVLPNWPEDQ